MMGRETLPQTEAIVGGHLSTIAVATQLRSVNKLGRFDAVIRNAAVGYREAFRLTADVLAPAFAINTLSA